MWTRIWLSYRAQSVSMLFIKNFSNILPMSSLSRHPSTLTVYNLTGRLSNVERVSYYTHLALRSKDTCINILGHLLCLISLRYALNVKLGPKGGCSGWSKPSLDGRRTSQFVGFVVLHDLKNLYTNYEHCNVALTVLPNEQSQEIMVLFVPPPPPP